MRNILCRHKARLSAAILAGVVILSGCGSSIKDSYGAFKISSSYDGALPTNKIKLYFLPHYTEVKNGSPEWKIYEELVNDSIKLLAEQKDYDAVNAGYIGKEALGKSNMLMDTLSCFNPAGIARDIRGAGLDWQEKAVMNFINKEFSQNGKEDSLILCLYTRPQYPCKSGGVVSPYPKPEVPPVYSSGVSRLELGYLLIDPVEKSIVKRRKVILTRGVETEVDPQTKEEHWKFGEDQSAFLEKAVNRLFNDFPLMNRRPARRVVDEQPVPELSSVTPLSAVKAAPVDDVYAKLAQQRADKKDYQITIESIDGRQWTVTINLKSAAAKSLEPGLNGGKTQDDWVACIAKDGFFHGRVGKADLEQIVKTFLNWVDNPDKTGHNN